MLSIVSWVFFWHVVGTPIPTGSATLGHAAGSHIMQVGSLNSPPLEIEWSSALIRLFDDLGSLSAWYCPLWPESHVFKMHRAVKARPHTYAQGRDLCFWCGTQCSPKPLGRQANKTSKPRQVGSHRGCSCHRRSVSTTFKLFFFLVLFSSSSNSYSSSSSSWTFCDQKGWMDSFFLQPSFFIKGFPWNMWAPEWATY